MKTATCFMAAATLVALFGVTVEAAGPSTKRMAKPSRGPTGYHTSYQGESIPLIGADNGMPYEVTEPQRARAPQHVTARTSTAAARRSTIQRTSASIPTQYTHDTRIQPTGSVEMVSSAGCTSCGDYACDGGCGEDYLIGDSCCGDPYCTSCCDSFFQIGAGVELTFLKPHYEDRNLAFGREESNDVTFQTFSDTEFDYDTDVAPRVWFSVTGGGQLGLRLEYWQFDHNAASLTGQPPANGFGSVYSPEIEGRQLSSNTPNSVLTAGSGLDAYVIDVAATQKVVFGCWGLETLGGIRFAQIEQAYNGTLVDVQTDQNDLRETLSFYHKLQGVGPSFGVQFRRPFSCNVSLFGKARGSLLFGDGNSNLLNSEDQDLDNEFTVRHNTLRDDLFSIAELQVGIGWSPGCVGRVIPSAHIAYEGQLWSDVGSPSSQHGDLGFYGFNVGVGLDW